MDDPAEPEPLLTLAVPRERTAGERRVAVVPDSVADLAAAGLSVVVESGAGKEAYFDDEAYFLAGARIESQPGAIYRQADILAKVNPPAPEEIDLLRRDALVISFLDPSHDRETVEHLARRGITAFSFTLLPRITKAQSMDAMSSMSTISGYKAALVAANTIGRVFPLLMTAAGTLTPARVVVVGAGVAGLQALATARRLGAVTSACDARPAAREQIESVGARFIDMSAPEGGEDAGGYAREVGEAVLAQERDAIRDHVAEADVVISTAQVPGARAPLLIDEAMVRAMRPGSVIVDLAAPAGGNCELTEPGTTVVTQGVTIFGPLNLPSTVPIHASQMYSRNVLSVIQYLVKDGALHLDPDDEIVRSACITRVEAAAP